MAVERLIDAGEIALAVRPDLLRDGSVTLVAALEPLRHAIREGRLALVEVGSEPLTDNGPRTYTQAQHDEGERQLRACFEREAALRAVAEAAADVDKYLKLGWYESYSSVEAKARPAFDALRDALTALAAATEAGSNCGDAGCLGKCKPHCATEAGSE